MSSIEDTQVIDAIGLEEESGTIVLSIIDGWPWDDEPRHLQALQDKLNAYFGFVESGQINEAYPDAVGQPLRIDVVSKFSLPSAADAFMAKASEVASQLGIEVTARTV
ncbi:MAG: DUF6572 domain-containing protein [Myxococcota bacterium]